MTTAPDFEPDAIVVGAGLAGLVATHELVLAGKKVLVLDQENRANLGGQAFWSLGGLFFVDSPEQRRMGIKDSHELAMQDWLGSAQFGGSTSTRAATTGAARWAEAYVDFAAGEKRDYLHDLGLKSVPMVGWAERGGADPQGHGNSVPRFHLTWGTGPEVVRIFEEPVLAGEARGLVGSRSATGSTRSSSRTAAVGRRPRLGARAERRAARSGVVAGRRRHFELRGAGGHRHLAAASAATTTWCARPGPPSGWAPAPEHLISGVPAHVDGRMLAISEAAGARVVNRDRMWHYTEGIHNWDPIWPDHAIRIIPGPSSLWLDATGKRFPAPNFPGCDNLQTMRAILATGYDYSWFVLTQIDHREGVRAVGLRAEPRHHREGPARPAARAALEGRARRRSRSSRSTARTSSSPTRSTSSSPA